MGLKYSKFAFLSYEEAVKRETDPIAAGFVQKLFHTVTIQVSNDEFNRIKLAFKRASGNSNLMPKSSFMHDILGDIVKKRLAEHIYMQCGGTVKGIHFKEVLCTLVMITLGHVEEKVKFIFGMMSVDGTNVTSEDLENFLNICECENVPQHLKALFKQVDKLSYNDFYDWILQNENFCDVSKWLISEQRGERGIKLSSFDGTPSFYQSLEKITNFCQNDLIELEKRYWSLKSFSESGKYDSRTFSNQVSPPLPKQFSQGLFNAIDENRDGHIDFKELVLGIFTCCRGSTSERLTFCFKVFDSSKDGVLNEERLREIAIGLFEIWQSHSNEILDTTPSKFVNEMFQDKEPRQLTIQEFLSWASSNPFMHEFLLLLSQICHIVFGLRPCTKEEEGFVVRRWIEREIKKGLCGSHMYYLISSSWWHTWMDYVNFKALISSSDRRHKSTSSGISAQSLWVDIESRVHSQSDSGDATSQSSRSSLSLNASTNTKRPVSSTTQVFVESSNAVTSNGGKVPKLTTTFHVYPGVIDNSCLLQSTDLSKQVSNLTGEGGRLKTGLVKGKDYEVVPEPVWRALFTWYGGNIALPRTVIRSDDPNDPSDLSDPSHENYIIELYPIQLHLYRHAPAQRHLSFSFHSLGLTNFSFQLQTPNQTQTALPAPPKRALMYYGCFSKKNTLKQVEDYISSRLKIRPDDLRLWNYHDNHLVLLEDDEPTLEDYRIKDGHHILIEVRNRDMSWPEEMNSLVATKNFRERSNTGPLVKGATGLHNLGNTCFMNSAIQCISNTHPLTLYFLGKLHLFELNRSNPLGLKGILAKRYGELVYDLWNGLYRSIAPVKLRWTIGKYAPRFNGFQQHDAQELLSFLLDGLHEDLNRVHDKPYIELKDSAGRPDKEVAQEAWENHRKRNQSIIVDLFQGQLKSQVRCLACGNCSVRFDPYTFLSLPIPMENSLHLEISVFTMDGAVPVRYGLLLCNEATVEVLKKALSQLSRIPINQLIIAETFGPTISAFLPDEKKLRENVTGILNAYEVRKEVNVLQVQLKSNIAQRSSAPAILESDGVSTNQNRLGKPAVLGGSPNSSNQLSVKGSKPQSRSPKSPRRIRLAPFKRFGNGVVPAKNNAFTGNGLLPSQNKSCSDNNLSSDNMPASLSSNTIIVIMHRKMVQMDAYFLSWQKFHPTLFGIPILVCSTETSTNKEIYEEVWRQTKRFVSTHQSERRNQSENRRYSFELKTVQRDGQFCSSCPWYKFCRGCKLKCDDSHFGSGSLNLAIDWDPTTLHLSYQQGQERLFSNHPSLEESMRLLREPINIDQCLKDFTKEEELGVDETWYCPACKQHQKIAKKISLWTLPPILIIHLKRFQLLNNRWIKSNKIVKFSMESFDPSTYLVERDRRKRNPSERQSGKILTVKASRENQADSISTSAGQKCTEMSFDRSCEDGMNLDLDDIENSLEERETEQASNDDYTYRLYAISCHSGMLSGGHYISYARNPNGKWFKYNDSSCKEVEESAIEKESPYLLFFEKEGINVSDYLPEVKNYNLDVSLDDDEFETEVKKYCVLQ